MHAWSNLTSGLRFGLVLTCSYPSCTLGLPTDLSARPTPLATEVTSPAHSLYRPVVFRLTSSTHPSAHRGEDMSAEHDDIMLLSIDLFRATDLKPV